MAMTRFFYGGGGGRDQWQRPLKLFGQSEQSESVTSCMILKSWESSKFHLLTVCVLFKYMMHLPLWCFLVFVSFSLIILKPSGLSFQVQSRLLTSSGILKAKLQVQKKPLFGIIREKFTETNNLRHFAYATLSCSHIQLGITYVALWRPLWPIYIRFISFNYCFKFSIESHISVKFRLFFFYSWIFHSKYRSQQFSIF